LKKTCRSMRCTASTKASVSLSTSNVSRASSCVIAKPPCTASGCNEGGTWEQLCSKQQNQRDGACKVCKQGQPAVLKLA
jgi:hypothetical protein